MNKTTGVQVQILAIFNYQILSKLLPLSRTQYTYLPSEHKKMYIRDALEIHMR